MKPVLSYCLHRTDDNSDVAVPIEDAHDFLRKQTLAHWRALPLRRRMTEGGVEDAIEKALVEAAEVMRQASLRV